MTNNSFEQARLVFFCLILAISSSCTEVDGPTSWPSYTEEAYSNLVEHRAVLQSLVKMLEDSKYVAVSRASSGRAVRSFERNGQMVTEMWTDSEQWVERMSAANLDTALRNDRSYTFLESISPNGATSIHSVMYIYADTMPLKMCIERFQDVPCGMCDMFREEDWTVRYMWIAGSQVADYFESTSIDNLTDENAQERQLEQFKALNESNQECLKTGLVQMGNKDVSTYFE